MNLRRQVLIFHNAALGDFLMTWPLAMALGRTLAQSRIIYVTASQKGQLAERLIGVEFSDVENGWHGLHADGDVSDVATKLLKSMQLGVVFSQQRDDRFMTNIQTAAGDVPLVHISPNPQAGVHVWQHQLEQLQSFPVIRQGVEQVQNLIRSQGISRTKRDRGVVVIHPGSGAERKNWPIDRFIEVATILKSQKKKVTVVIGEAERERLSDAEMTKLKSAGQIKSCNTLLELHDVLNAAGCYVGNDSGPTHLAAMMGLSVAALFGPTSNAECWRPMGPSVNVLPFDATPEQVVETITS